MTSQKRKVAIYPIHGYNTIILNLTQDIYIIFCIAPRDLSCPSRKLHHVGQYTGSVSWSCPHYNYRYPNHIFFFLHCQTQEEKGQDQATEFKQAQKTLIRVHLFYTSSNRSRERRARRELFNENGFHGVGKEMEGIKSQAKRGKMIGCCVKRHVLIVLG